MEWLKQQGSWRSLRQGRFEVWCLPAVIFLLDYFTSFIGLITNFPIFKHPRIRILTCWFLEFNIYYLFFENFIDVYNLSSFWLLQLTLLVESNRHSVFIMEPLLHSDRGERSWLVIFFNFSSFSPFIENRFFHYVLIKIFPSLLLPVSSFFSFPGSTFFCL